MAIPEFSLGTYPSPSKLHDPWPCGKFLLAGSPVFQEGAQGPLARLFKKPSLPWFLALLKSRPHWNATPFGAEVVVHPAVVMRTHSPGAAVRAHSPVAAVHVPRAPSPVSPAPVTAMMCDV